MMLRIVSARDQSPWLRDSGHAFSNYYLQQRNTSSALCTPVTGSFDFVLA